ncbi:hypothetical protein BaRGS_00032261 [Batillaria attramentaria]|uniref:Uncharacterized protein n=1 Tax=Batillaria attramentaria TaxID=370345 RepID=A0ABD0JN76_9CAEN
MACLLLLLGLLCCCKRQPGSDNRQGYRVVSDDDRRGLCVENQQPRGYAGIDNPAADSNPSSATSPSIEVQRNFRQNDTVPKPEADDIVRQGSSSLPKAMSSPGVARVASFFMSSESTDSYRTTETSQFSTPPDCSV